MTIAPAPAVGRIRPLTPRDRWQMIAGVVGVCSVLLFIEGTQNYLSWSTSDRPTPWLTAIEWRVPYWTLLALLAPFVLALARHFPLTSDGWRRALLIHAAGALVFALLHLSGMAAHTAYVKGTWEVMRGMMLKLVGGSLLSDALIYVGIVGGYNAFHYHREAKARELATSQLQSSLTEARLAALRGQLNPHFLFNTLNAISTMALRGEQDHVVTTLGHLGELLQRSLDGQLPQEISLGEELTLLDPYLDIQRVRFGDRLTIHRDVEPAALDALVPSMLLQPLVENAIVHGIAPIPGPGEVRIHAWRRDGALHLEVTDSGPGFRPPEARREPEERASGIGLANTRARLGQLYGDAHTLTLGGGDGRETCVAVTIPYRAADRPPSR